ncbi:MAG: DUF1730 domain-containing protein [Clostridia bacterium]|nr:DUF1730 domain-containing protein [Clostridia bacterium]
MIDSIISETAEIYGICSFDRVKESLIQCRKIKLIPENSQSVIVMLFPYLLDGSYADSDISKYAVVRDYHIVIEEALGKTVEKLKASYPDEKFAAFTDNSPIPEVKAAVLSGLGVKGKNGLLINKKYGSWVFIGEIVTTLKLKCSNSAESYCLGCDKCVRSCPTSAIKADGVNKAICLSDITQRKGELSQTERNLIAESGCAWGCDICQNICPMNANAVVAPFAGFRDGASFSASLDGDISDRAYAWRGKKVIERNLHIINKKEG